MTLNIDNETWLIEEGDRVIQKKARSGVESLTTWERLVYALWVADYGMRNAGDLDTAKDVCAEFQLMARSASAELLLTLTGELVSKEAGAIAAVYFDLFDTICDEVRTAEPNNSYH
jgi:hypothetical protein